MSPTRFNKKCRAIIPSGSEGPGSRSSFANCSILSTMQSSCGPWLAGIMARNAGLPKQALFKSGLCGARFTKIPLLGRRAPLRALLAQRIGPDRLSGNIGLRPGVGFVGGDNLGDLLFDRR